MTTKDKILFLVGAKDRPDVFKLLFTDEEQTAIVNALWRRSEDDKDKGTYFERQNEALKLRCAQLAKELT